VISWYIEFKDKASEEYYFPDFHYQELLAPYLGTGKVEIDEYGRTEYYGEELDRLVARLKHIYDYFEAKSVQWEIIETEFREPIKNDNSSTSTKKFLLKRQIILQLLNTIIQMGTQARNANGILVFLGD
jgi:hypothetical protein